MKKKLIGWHVSRCHTDSKRELYIAELSKYISVDIFGKCSGRMACREEEKGTNCTQDLIQSYKFYFAGENSICRDYFTGKFYYI